MIAFGGDVWNVIFGFVCRNTCCKGFFPFIWCFSLLTPYTLCMLQINKLSYTGYSQQPNTCKLKRWNCILVKVWIKEIITFIFLNKIKIIHSLRIELFTWIFSQELKEIFLHMQVCVYRWNCILHVFPYLLVTLLYILIYG